MAGYRKTEKVSLKTHPGINEIWVQNVLADYPSLLGLGELEVRDRERIQPKAGRLDLLLQDPESDRRFEVEIQLGATDPSHIIRAVEYWDIERKRFPRYKHHAVIVAEEITSRFLNVIGLFNGAIPIIAIQMTALEIDGEVSLLFTKVLDETLYHQTDEDDDVPPPPADRPSWEKKASKKTVELADQILGWLRELDPELELNYNKHYIGLTRSGQAFNFVSFRPKKQRLNFEIKLPRTDETDALIEDAGLDTLEYSTQWQLYRLSLEPAEIKQHELPLKALCKSAFERRING